MFLIISLVVIIFSFYVLKKNVLNHLNKFIEVMKNIADREDDLTKKATETRAMITTILDEKVDATKKIILLMK